MRHIKLYFALVAAVLASVTSCKDDSIVIVPEWESGVHGLTVFSSSSDDVNFIKGDPTVTLTFDMSWNSIDHKNTVEKIDIYILFNEAYTDQDGNPKTAKHGGDDGILYMTLEGGEVPADKATTSFGVSQTDVYDLYDGAMYDYYGTGTALPVWGAGSIRADRNTGNFKFVDGDAFQMRWEFTTADGRVFNKWSPSVCNEFPGANCVVNWSAVCSQVIAEPAGTWVIAMTDTYGDGWNGGAIKVIVDGVGTNYTLASGSSGTTNVVVPGGTTTLQFEYVSGDWDSEVIFSITSPKGNVVAKGGPSPPIGILTLDLCKENG